MQETQCLQIRAIQEIIFEMGIRSHHSWALGSSKSLFCHKAALSPVVTLQIPGHLVLPPKSSPGVPCPPIHPRSAGEWRPWAHWCLLCSMHRFFPCREAFLHHPLLIFSRVLPGFSSLSLLDRMRGVCSVFFWYLCLSCSLVFVHWCVPSIQNRALHIVAAQQTLVEPMDGVHFYSMCQSMVVSVSPV